ncbi:putative ribonuclease H-like domain-containing protein [Tanacetum coccineum]
MHKKFQMSSMGELTFFLGLQVKQKEDRIFISQDKYVIEILKKFSFSDVKTASTPMKTHKPLLKDADGEDVDEHLYRSMIGSLMYLTSSRPDIMFAVCACARFQVNPKSSHLHAVKRIFRYLKGQPKLGIWYPKDSPFDLVAYTDSDYAGASLDKKSTTGGCQFLGCRLISWQCKKQTMVANSTTEAEYIAASNCCGQYYLHSEEPCFHSKTKHIEIRHHFIKDSYEKKLIQTIKIHTDQNVTDLLTKAFDVSRFQYLIAINAARHKLTAAWSIGIKRFWDTVKTKTVNGEVQLQALVDKKNVIIIESTIRRDLQLEDAKGTDCLPNATIFGQLTLMGYEKLSQKLTFYKAFFSPQWKFFIHTILQCLSAKTTAWNEFNSTMASAIICLATNQKFNFSKYIFDSMVKNVDRKGFSGRVTPLFPTMMVQAQEEMGEGSANPTDPHHTPIITQPLTSQPQKKQKPRNPKRKYIEIPQSSGPTEPIADEAANEEYVPTHSNDPLLSAQEISSLKLRVKRLEKKRGSRTHKLKRLFKVGRSTQVVFSKDEGLGDQEDASKQGRKIDDIEKDAEDVVEKEVSTANPVTTAGEVVTNASVEVSTATTTTIAAITEFDLTLAQALPELRSAKPKVVVQEPVQNPGESTTRTTLTPIPSNIKDKGKAKMIEPEKPLKKKEQIRLDEELAFKLQAKEEEQARLAREKAEKVEEANIPWDNVQAMIEADRLLAERFQARDSKRAGEELEQEVAKKQKIKDDKDKEDLKQCFEIVQDDEVAIDVVPLATKPAPIVGFQIHRKGRNGYYEIIRADGSAKTYLLFSQLLKEFDREDLENLWKLVKAKHGNTRPKEGYKRVLWGDLKTIFEHHVEDLIWRNLQGKKVLLWRLYDSCGIHFVRFEDMHVYMLVEKRYPLTPATITDMLNKKLKSYYWNKMCYQLLKLMTKQLKNQ